MAAGSGVTYTALGGDRWRVRWRERRPEPEGGWRSRETTWRGPELGTEGVEGYALRIRTALAREGRFEPELDRAAHEPPPAPANLLDTITAMIDARTTAGKYTGSTPKTFRSYRNHLARALYKLEQIPDEEPLPVTVLSRANFVRIMDAQAQAGLSPMMRYSSLRLLLDAWIWAAAENAEARGAGRRDPYPQLPPSPPAGASKDYLPRSPKYGRTVAPTMTHVDACLRRLPAKASTSTRLLAIFMRYTGLRVSQALAIHREDVDVTARTLVVRVGKSELERADQRPVPLSRHLLAEDDVREVLEVVARGPLFRHAYVPGKRHKAPALTLRTAWEAATKAGEVPRQVWAPPNRKHTRPDHAFRAAFQATLTDARVDVDVVDFLVGHEDGTTREVHYGRELLDKARAAVDAIPSIDWTGPALTDNVVPMARTG